MCKRRAAATNFSTKRSISFSWTKHPTPYARTADRSLKSTFIDDRTAHRQIEAGIRADDHRCLAAHLGGHDAVEMVRRQLLNAFAHVVTAGKGATFTPGLRHQLTRERGSPWTVEHTRREAGFLGDFDDLLADRPVCPGWLEDGCVAFGPARASHNGEGEIPGRNDGDNAPRLAAHEGVFLRDLGRQGHRRSACVPVPIDVLAMCSPTPLGRHSVMTFPHSRAINSASASVSRLMSWARLSNSSARRIRLVLRQSGNAFRAAATAASASDAVAEGKMPTTSSRRAGLRLSKRPPVRGCHSPPTKRRPLTADGASRVGP